MAVNFGLKPVNVAEGQLELVWENFLARPCTVDESTIADLQADEDGRKIIPQGTYLTGSNGTSLLLDPNQIAKAVEVTATQATVTMTNNKIVITAKASGSLAYVVDIEKGTGIAYNPNISYDSASKTATITLAVDSNNDVITTVKEVVNLINNDPVVNSFIVAELADDADPTALAVEEESTTTGGGAESVTDATIDGILYHSVDVTEGEAVGAMMIAGVVNIDKLPVEPGDAVKAKLPKITFARRD